MIKRIAILGLALIFSLASQKCNADESSPVDDTKPHKKEIALRKLKWATSRYEEVEKKLNEQQKRICRAHLSLLKAKFEGRDEKELLGLYKQLQDLIIDEAHRRNKRFRVGIANTTLWRVFNIEKPLLGTCFYIARLCRDSKKKDIGRKNSRN